MFETDIIRDFIKIAREWSYDDDWNIPTIHISGLERIAALIEAGYDDKEIIAHANHVGKNCCRMSKETEQ